MSYNSINLIQISLTLHSLFTVAFTKLFSVTLKASRFPLFVPYKSIKHYGNDCEIMSKRDANSMPFPPQFTCTLYRCTIALFVIMGYACTFPATAFIRIRELFSGSACIFHFAFFAQLVTDRCAFF